MIIYPDSSLFLEAITARSSIAARRATRVLLAVDERRVDAVASFLVLAEVMNPGASAPAAVADAIARVLETGDRLQWSELDRRTASAARALGRRHPRVSGADAVHLATALARGAEYFLTLDKKLLRYLHDADETSPYELDGLTVQLPRVVWSATLDESAGEAADDNEGAR